MKSAVVMPPHGLKVTVMVMQFGVSAGGIDSRLQQPSPSPCNVNPALPQRVRLLAIASQGLMVLHGAP
jgi:hypothetical protein